MARRLRRLVGIAAALSVVTAGWSAAAGPASRGDVRTPTVTGPVTGGSGPSLLGPDVSSLGYAREEFFVEGEAVDYQPVGRLTSGGKWRVDASETAPFNTRIVVWRPAGFGGLQRHGVRRVAQREPGLRQPAGLAERSQPHRA